MMLGYVLIGAAVLAALWWLMKKAQRSKTDDQSVRFFSDDVIGPLEEATRELSPAEFNALGVELEATTSVSRRMLQQGISPMLVQATATADALRRIRAALETRRANEQSALDNARRTGIEVGEDGHLKPDMLMAARGVAAVFSTKLSRPYLNEAELRAEVANKVEPIVLSDMSAQQKMSAVWGALYAVEDRTDIYLGALQAYDDVVRNSANPPSTDRYEAAALPYLATVLMQHPDEYTRYVGFELASEEAALA